MPANTTPPPPAFPFAPCRCNPLLQKMLAVELELIDKKSDYTRFPPLMIRFLNTVSNAYRAGCVSGNQLKAMESMVADAEEMTC